jgi:acyl-CoA reductase-like NAD-dependent aldehyde dehydrogenase
MPDGITIPTKTRAYGHWINGQETGAPAIPRHSPADGRLLASFAAGTAEDVTTAVHAARYAFETSGWRTRPGVERAAALNAWADLLEKHSARLAIIEAEEVGKPIKYARGEISHCVTIIRHAAALAWQIKGDAFSDLGPGALGLVTREPRGVIGMIVPWNFPLVTLMQKLPFALASGNTAVVKPSEFTSGTALIAASLAREAGIPNGVINIVTGHGDIVGKAIAANPGVNMLSFTGSTAIGRQIAHSAAERIIPAALELGGKGANIVFAGADLDQALDGVLFGAILNQGQECCAGARLLIEDSIADDFTRQLVQRAVKVISGPPLDEATDLGPMIHEKQMRSVLAHIQTAINQGAKLLTGGVQLPGPGFFLPATILDDVTPAMEIFHREVFGPVLTITRFKTDEQALALANDTEYGLASGVWTSNLSRAHAIAAGIQTGNVYVNTYLESATQLPFGGWKSSGLGRELGFEGLLEFTRTKSTFFKLTGRTLTLPHTA